MLQRQSSEGKVGGRVYAIGLEADAYSSPGEGGAEFQGLWQVWSLAEPALAALSLSLGCLCPLDKVQSL